MRPIDADNLESIKFHSLPYTHITPTDADAESYKRGWNDAIDSIIENEPTIEPERKWETCFDCPLSHGCPKINGCTNEQAEQYASEIPDDCPIERKTGRWIESNPQNSEICRLINCSECGKGYIVNINVPYEDWTDAHKFCVECGAKMEVEHAEV